MTEEPRERKGKRLKLLVPLGEGGHSTEMLHLVKLLGDRHEYHYMLVREDPLSEGKMPVPGRIYRCSRPHLKVGAQWKVLFGYARLTVQSLGVLARVRPDVLIHSGPAMTIPISVLSKIFRVPIVYVETGSRVHSTSRTGRFMHRIADIFFVQWPELQDEVYPDAVFAGLLL